MAVVLQRTTSNAFDKPTGHLSREIDGHVDHASDLDSTTADVSQDKSRQVSSASIFSIASAPTRRNNENISPLPHLRSHGTTLRSVSSQNTKTPSHQVLRWRGKQRNFTFQPLIGRQDKCDFADVHYMKENGATQEHITTIGAKTQTEVSLPSAPQGGFPSLSLVPPPDCEHKADEEDDLATISKVIGSKWRAIPAPETSRCPQTHELVRLSTSKDSDVADPLASLSQRITHQQKLSDGSSGFVHSMKTASFTNASLSIIARSRVGKSTDSYMPYGSQSRHSADSDRPMSSCSFDDVAIKRGFKRQRIIDELISTEVSYVADLKALVYLYSTLLASTSSIPNRLRSAIARNVDGILHAHEKVVQRLHYARLRAAARRWAATTMPTKLGQHRRSHLRRSERENYARPLRLHRHTRTDEWADAVSHHPQQSGSAEPMDVQEVTTVLKDAVKYFYAYEEYCANFEIIGHELQKHMPVSWSTYESGMESLSKVILAIDQRQANDRKGLTVGDLLIKPIQRLTKYPLLLEQLLQNTPVADAPATHVELDSVLQAVRHVVQTVNLARDNQYTRLQIQRRWMLQDRLDLSRLNLTPEQFRSLGSVELCGVLHVIYQTAINVNGGYALCALLDEHFLVAMPTSGTGQFEAMALIQLSDIKLEVATNGKGLQCASSFFTWKVSFSCVGYYHELILSGCSKIEEDQWTAGLRGDFSQPVHHTGESDISAATCVAFDLKSVGVVFSSQKSLSRESAVRRAATVGGRPSISQVIVRNTHNTHDLHEYRELTSTITSINRSQSHMNTKRVPVLEPKRSERTRLEHSISEIWTKERLPFPGMIGSRGGQIIRASAGSLARKLSLASIHTPFSKARTSSLSMASKKSYDLFNDTKSAFEVRRREPEHMHAARTKPKDIPEVDDMRSVVIRMMGTTTPVVKEDDPQRELVVDHTRSKRNGKLSFREVGPDDSAAFFYESSGRGASASDGIVDMQTIAVAGADWPRRRKNRWSKPMEKLKEFGSEAKNMISSGSSSGS